MAKPSCRRLETHLARRPRSAALASAGNSIEARMAMIAMTTKSSINVNARRLLEPGAVVESHFPITRKLYDFGHAGSSENTLAHDAQNAQGFGSDAPSSLKQSSLGRMEIGSLMRYFPQR